MKLSFKALVGASVFCSLSLATLPSVELAGLNVVGGAVFAAESAQAPAIKLPGCKAEPEKRKLKTVTQKFIKKMTPIDEMIQPAEDEKTKKAPPANYKGAWKELEKLIDRCDDCSKNELAQIYQRAAIVQYNLENIPKAIEYFNKVIAQSPDIHISQETGLMYQVAQLYSAEEKYAEALKTFDKWESLCPTSVSDSYFYIRGQTLYLMDRKDEALKQVQKSIDLVTAKGEIGQESWYRLQMAIYIDKEDFKSAQRLAEILVVNYPTNRYFVQLSQIYGMNGEDKKQMALMDALNVAGILDKESQYRNLSYLFLGSEAPYLAAKTMEKGVKNKAVERTAKNLESWGMSLFQAQETDKALPLMEEAAKKSDDGKLYVRLAAIYLDAEKFDDVLEAAKKALDKKGLKSEGEAYFYMGYAYMSKKHYNDSLEAFKKAAKDEKYEKYVNDLLKYVKREKEREEQLKKANLNG